jgi:outer membrane immunogenic protein
MRHRFSAAIAIATFVLAATDMSGAADLRVKAPVAPPPPPAWTGCYVGLNAGGVWGRMRDKWTNISPSIFLPPEFETVGGGTIDASGFTGGGQLGCNRQIDAVVFGVEADIQYTQLEGTREAFFPGDSSFRPLKFREDFQSKWLGTFRGRVGWLMNPDVLLYATGGLAVARIKTFDSFGDPATPATHVTTSGSRTQVGWTVGAGAEWMFAPRWSVKAEYLYVDLGSSKTIGFLPDTRPLSSHSHGLTEHIARFGLNYKL